MPVKLLNRFTYVSKLTIRRSELHTTRLAFLLDMRRSRRHCATRCTTLLDVLHISEITELLLDHLSIQALLQFACAASACKAAVRPKRIDVSIIDSASLGVLSSLQQLGCLQELLQANRKARTCNAVAGAHLGILRQCRSLRGVTLVLDVHFDNLPLPKRLLDFELPCSIWMDPGAVELVANELLAALPKWVDRTVHAKREDDCCNCSLKEQSVDEKCRDCMLWKWTAGTSAQPVSVTALW